MFSSFNIWRKEDFSNPSALQVHLPTHIVCIFLGCLFLFCIPCLLSVTFMFHLPPHLAQSKGDIKHLLPYWLRKLLFISPENSHFIAAPSAHTQKNCWTTRVRAGRLLSTTTSQEFCGVLCNRMWWDLLIKTQVFAWVEKSKCNLKKKKLKDQRWESKIRGT